MRPTFIKRNSHTQAQAVKTSEVIAHICRRTGITRDEWTALLFETGCACAEQSIGARELRRAFLTEPERGFWSWWICAFTDDDRVILKQRLVLSPDRYADLKYDLVYLNSTK